jgi:glycosyltransferase involved in cell wall biosynthesis
VRRRPFRFWQAVWLADYARRYLAWRRAAIAAALAAVDDASQSAWHGHDLTGLIAASGAQGRGGGALVYDSHELYLESGSLPHLPRPVWRLLFRYERRLVRRADLVMTVNQSIARELADRYEVRAPTVVMNCPPARIAEIGHRPSPLRAAVGWDGPIVVIHGSLSPGKGLMEAVEAIRRLPRCALVMLGRGPLGPALRDIAESEELRGRFFVMDWVSQDELIGWLAGADLALITFTPGTLNQRYATPNRLFESFAAGLPVVVSDFPELRRIVEADDLGVVCDPTDTDSIVAAVERLIGEAQDAREARRHRARSAFERIYNWERQERGLVEGYRGL